LPKPLDLRKRNREYDRRREAENPWRAWYKTGRWQALRRAQLVKQPLCCFCEARGRIVAATVCDHVEPHRGDSTLFWNEDNLQSLCADCHNSDKARIERGGMARQRIGYDGWPV
jgi:5-methylcytosine-specific restriction protein A